MTRTNQERKEIIELIAKDNAEMLEIIRVKSEAWRELLGEIMAVYGVSRRVASEYIFAARAMLKLIKKSQIQIGFIGTLPVAIVDKANDTLPADETVEAHEISQA